VGAVAIGVVVLTGAFLIGVTSLGGPPFRKCDTTTKIELNVPDDASEGTEAAGFTTTSSRACAPLAVTDAPIVVLLAAAAALLVPAIAWWLPEGAGIEGFGIKIAGRQISKKVEEEKVEFDADEA
jgi:hypothetical protein